MIQKITPHTYYNKLGHPIAGIVTVEVVSFETTKTEKIFKLIDNLLVDGNVSHFLAERTERLSNEQFDVFDVWLEANLDFTGMTSSQKEWEKIRHQTLYVMQNKLFEDGTTIYGGLPNEWEQSPIVAKDETEIPTTT